MNQKLDVPLFVDDPRVVTGDFPFIRCNYLTIERDEPDPGWHLRMAGEELPFMLLHLGGVITQPVGGARFVTSTSIQALFDILEKDDRLSIEVADLWIPRSLFPEHFSSGEVYRMARELFASAFRYRHGGLDARSFQIQCDEQRNGLTFSEQETSSFLHWHEQESNYAKEMFPKSRARQLRPRETDR